MSDVAETRPLLSSEDSSNSDPSDVELLIDQDSCPKSHATRVIVLIAICTIIADLAGYGSIAPQLQIFEQTICREYYASIGITRNTLDQDQCKIEPVQSELALINGWFETFQTVPGDIALILDSLTHGELMATLQAFFLAIPFGAVADRIGRKPVMIAGMVGCLLGEGWIRVVAWFAPRIPLRAVWFAAFSQLMGGGAPTAALIMWVMVADTCSKERRTLAFSQLAGAVLISEIIATPASAALIPISPWLPYLMSYGLYIIGFLFASCIPETLGNIKKPSPSQDGNEVRGKSMFSTFRTELRTVQQSLNLIRENLNVALVLICFFTSSLGKQAIPLILQYGPKKFHWTIAHTSYFLSLRGAVNFILLLVILPAISEFLQSKRYYPALRDKRLTQVSTALHIGGAIIIFFAASSVTFVVGLIVFALGGSSHITARSLVTSLVDPNLLGTAYACITTVTSAGIIFAGPFLAYTFKWGMILGGNWIGMPFLAATGLYILGLLAVTMMRIANSSD